jgi:hypothetical protein
MDKGLTIATVSRGDYAGLCKTIDSITRQDDKTFDLVLVLSGYSKKELDSIRNRIRSVRFIEIEDNGQGIYPAMNLALRSSNSSHILFLNGGDSFFSEESVALINRKLHSCSGDKNIAFSVCLNFQNSKYLRRACHKGRCLDPRVFYPPHQGFVALVDQENTFSPAHGSSGDTFWMKNQINRHGCVYLNLILSEFELGGVSNNPRNMINFKTQPFKNTLKYLLFRLVGEQNYYRVVYWISGFSEL